MLHSTAHWQKTVHGYSGFRAPLHAELNAMLRTFPDATSVNALASLGVKFIVVHPELYPPGEWAAVQTRLHDFAARLHLVYTDTPGSVYELRIP